MENKFDNELAAVLAHEVKNPVAIIKANVDFIRQMLPLSAIKNIEAIDNALVRIDRIIESYRLISVKSGDRELIYVEDMLIDIIEDYNISAPNIDFVYNCSSELAIYGSYDKLSILFYNIYKNAVEAIKHKGIVETTAYAQNGSAVIKISDNGGGIEDINAIGTPYYTTKEGGTGLGIIICRNIVEEHKGRLIFENNDEGSIVTVILPIKKE